MKLKPRNPQFTCRCSPSLEKIPRTRLFFKELAMAATNDIGAICSVNHEHPSSESLLQSINGENIPQESQDLAASGLRTILDGELGSESHCSSSEDQSIPQDEGHCVTASLLSSSNHGLETGISQETSQVRDAEGDALLTEGTTHGSSDSSPPDSLEDTRTRGQDDSAKDLKRHTLSLWLASAYVVASIFVWVITCTLSYRPIQFRTYFDTIGRYSEAQYASNDQWRRFSRVGLQMLAALGIPITSATCASAAVVYCQRSAAKEAPSITMRQMLALADKGWLDHNTWIELLRSQRRRTNSPLILL